MWFPAVPFNPSIDHMTENGRSVGGFRHVLLSIIALQEMMAPSHPVAEI